MDVAGSLITSGADGEVDQNETADEQLFTRLLPLCRDSMGSKDSGSLIKATLTLLLASGQSVVVTGWVRNFVADRDAPEGIIEIKISFNFLFDTVPTFNA